MCYSPLVEYLVEPVETDAAVRLLEELRRTHANGGAILRRFPTQQGATLLTMPREDQLGTLLRSGALRDTIAEAGQSRVTKAPAFQVLARDGLEDSLCRLLLRRGAYVESRLGKKRARELAGSFIATIPRIEGALILQSSDAWCGWFFGVAWDESYFILQADGAAWWLLCTTDTD